MPSRSGVVIRYAGLLFTIVAAGVLVGIAHVSAEKGIAQVRALSSAIPENGMTEVTVTEGTNFSVAASPDGHTLAIDLLGSLWTVPGQGGAAKRITDELLEAHQPSFSPDGKQIVFQGFYDADGWDIWIIAPDGSGAKRITSGPYDDMEPEWSHDGTRIRDRKSVV